MKPLKSFKIENKKISIDGPTYIIAEIGINHGGSIIKCKKLIVAFHKRRFAVKVIVSAKRMPINMAANVLGELSKN